MLKIGILLGAGIGLEVVPECVKVMRAGAFKASLETQWHEFPIGRKAHELHGNYHATGYRGRIAGDAVVAAA